jgi:hypothetical protein
MMTTLRGREEFRLTYSIWMNKANFEENRRAPVVPLGVSSLWLGPDINI